VTRSIDDILNFRQDIAPFLAHLTRNRAARAGRPATTAKDALKTILNERALRASDDNYVSDAHWGLPRYRWDNQWEDLPPDQKSRFFCAVCFTETPIGEIHCLLEISLRQIELEPYGLVFMKERLSKRGVCPVFYMNNVAGDQDDVMAALANLARANPAAAQRFLPLVTYFGNFITPPGFRPEEGTKDFRWEREWRYPFARGPLTFDQDDVFIGLCPEDEIDEFEALFKPVKFIDPRLNTKWFADRLIEARQRHDLKTSVV
jgi:hypothetical protein